MATSPPTLTTASASVRPSLHRLRCSDGAQGLKPGDGLTLDQSWRFGKLRLVRPRGVGDNRAALGGPMSLVLAMAIAAAPPVADWSTRVVAHVRANEAAILREYVDLLSIPNLASDGPNIRRNADHIVKLLERRGVSARLLDGAGGPPPVFGELRSPGAKRTVLFYAHYDGQPVEPEKWASPPWQPVLRDKPVDEGGREIPLG